MNKPTRIFVWFAPDDQRFCVSFMRHLAPLGREQLIESRHRAQILPGAEVSRELDATIAWAEILIALISADFLAMDVCLDLLRAARLRGVRVVPVLVREAAWEGEAQIKDLQILPRSKVPVAAWQDPDAAFTEVVRDLKALIQAACLDAGSTVVPVAPPMPPPQVAYDPRFYVRQSALESRALDALNYPGQPLVLWGPPRCGKTWLLRHLLGLLRAKSPEVQVAELRLDEFSPSSRQDLGACLREFATHLGAALERSHDEINRAFSRTEFATANLNYYMERVLLPDVIRSKRRLLIALDHVDTVVGCSFQDTFFGLLRGWAERGVAKPWSSLSLLLMVSTTPERLVQNQHQSPFNDAVKIRIEDLDDGQLRTLAQQYGLAPTGEELQAVRQEIGGHPYLWRLLLYHCQRRSRQMIEMVTDTTVFADVLDRHRALLREQPGLRAAFSTAQESVATAVDSHAGYLLERAGLLDWDDAKGGYAPRYRLYRRILNKGYLAPPSRGLQ